MEVLRGKNVFYANNVIISFVPFDFAIGFVFHSPAFQEGDPAGQNEVYIHLSPVVAKRLANVLSTALADYEAKFGVISDVKSEVVVKGGKKGLQ